VLDGRPDTEVEHEVTVRNQLSRSRLAQHWEPTGMSWGGCLCGWTAGTDGEFLPAHVVATRIAQHLREAVTATMKP
jgi:hypothetical protein